MSFKENFITRLQQLPERKIQEFPGEIIPAGYRSAAVLLCLWPTDADGVELVLTKRTDKITNHKGQVSFPGGRIDDTDASPAAAALREAEEELGINPEQVTILGRLDDGWSRYGFRVIPVVGWMQQRPVLTPNTHEVAEILIADMATVMQPESSVEHKVVFPKGGKQVHKVQAFSWEGGYVWGLTADLLYEFILWIKDEPSDRFARRMERMVKYGV